MLDKFNRQTLIDRGFDKGFDKGFNEGKDKGFNEGKQEEKFSMAQRLIEMGLSLADVMRATQLSPDDLARLNA